MEKQKSEIKKGFDPNVNEKIIGRYGIDEYEKLSIDGITKACSYHELGFRSVVTNEELLLICTKFTEKSKAWKEMKIMN